MQYLPQENETIEYHATLEGVETRQIYCNPSLDFEFEIGLPDAENPNAARVVTLTPRQFIALAHTAYRLLLDGKREQITE